MNQPRKIWESRASGLSAMTTPGEFVRAGWDEIILPGDVVRLYEIVEVVYKEQALSVFTGRVTSITS
jgi:hypothetical protein